MRPAPAARRAPPAGRRAFAPAPSRSRARSRRPSRTRNPSSRRRPSPSRSRSAGPSASGARPRAPADRLVHPPPSLSARQGRPPPDRPARARSPATRGSARPHRAAAWSSECPSAAQATASVERCQRSWWSTSATDAPKRCRKLRLRRLHVLPLALERARLREVELDGEDPDVAGRPRLGRATSRRSAAGGGRRSLGEIGALDLARLVRLEHVAFLHVVEAVEEDAALEALAHLARVVLEALELRDRLSVDDGAVADDAHLARRAARRRS